MTVHGTQTNKAALPKDESEEPEDESASTFAKILPSIMIIVFFNIMPFVFIYVLNKKNMRNRLDDEDV